jgi:hypothetical protein
MPQDVNEDDLANWRKARTGEGMQACYADRCCTTLRTAITKAVGPSKLKRGASRYAIPREDMHPALRFEVEQIAAWKTSEFQPDRPSSARIRPVTANQLIVTLGQLTGYGQTIAGQAPYQSIACLVTMKHTGVGVTPHLYHDIVAFEWLRCHPKDYLTLSKILWHRNSQGSAGQTRSGTPAQKLGL